MESAHSTQPNGAAWRIEQIPSVCITLERRLDRWKRFQSQPGLQDLSVKRFVGVDGKTLTPETDERIATMTKRNIRIKSRRSHEELNSIGGVGCALSHIAVWQWMVDHQHPICLIFEDDAMVPPTFVPRANELIQTTLLQDKNAWDIWLLGGTWDDITAIPQENPVRLCRIGSFVLFHAYVLTLPTAQRLLKDAYPIHAHIDLWTSVYGYLHDLRIVGSPLLRLQQNPKSPTDIQTAPDCALCDVPADFQKTHRLITHVDHYLSLGAKAALVLVVMGYFLQRTLTRGGE